MQEKTPEGLNYLLVPPAIPTTNASAYTKIILKCGWSQNRQVKK